jgi:hypothetical protein
MTDERCQQYLEDPEAHAAHLDECEDCRALIDGLDADVPLPALTVEELPLAPWEGAAHRSWGLVLSLALLVLAAAVGLCLAAGKSVSNAVESSVGSFDMLRSVVRLAGDGAQHAPAGWQIAVLAGFVVVNVLLIALLRRAPRGIDA